LADRLEMLAYNAKPGTCLPDYWAHQYDQQANQVLVSKAKRKWSSNGDDSNLYGLEPNFGCCTANMHQGWPKFVAHLWMATPDNGLAAVAYGPSEVMAKVADGVDAIIRETTDYPFDGRLRFKVQVTRMAEFPLYFRIPAWADGASLKAGGRTISTKPGTFAVVKRTWTSGDGVELNLPMRLRTETRYNNAVAIYRGPLAFALKIGESYRRLKVHHDKLPAVDWEITPTTPWNYGLILDREHPEKSVKVTTGKIGKLPFAQETAPVVLHVKGREVPEWQFADNSAGETPTSPIKTGHPVTDLELVPYGSARLRITEFPVVDTAK